MARIRGRAVLQGRFTGRVDSFVRFDRRVHHAALSVAALENDFKTNKTVNANTAPWCWLLVN
jgi:hypothetical protein